MGRRDAEGDGLGGWAACGEGGGYVGVQGGGEGGGEGGGCGDELRAVMRAVLILTMPEMNFDDGSDGV